MSKYAFSNFHIFTDFPGLYSLNEKVAAERDAASAPQGSASSNQNSYAAPPVAAQPDYARQARRFNN
jgi:hypothetical protein